MEIVRNFIKISGLADADELPDKVSGPLIQYSESETIYIPESRPDIKSIFQVLVKTDIRTARSILTPVGNTIVIDGVKKLKIIYTQSGNSGKANFLDLELPYNTFIELPNNVEPDNISVYVLDAYFSLLDERRIYSHFVFMVNVSLGSLQSDNAEDTALNIPGKSKSDKLNRDTSSKILFIDSTSGDNFTEEPVMEVNEENTDGKEILIDLDAEYL